jgi:hypothetical protein
LEGFVRRTAGAQDPMTAREVVTAVREHGGWFVFRSRRPLPPQLLSQIAAFEDEIKSLVRRPQVVHGRPR